MHKLNFKFDHRTPKQGPSYKMLLGGMRAQLPSVVDLRPLCPPIENQGEESDCAACATAGNVEFLQLKELKNGSKVGENSLTYGGSFQRVSRQQLYWGGRALEGTTDQDGGISDMADMAKVTQLAGVARESLWPYTPADLFNPPPQAVLDDAALHKMPSFYPLDPGYQLKHSLWSGYPVMMAFQVPEAFEGAQMASSGEMPLADWMSGNFIGGHAVLAVGYDDARDMVIVRNSWGNAWGIDGYFHMPYEYADSEFAGNFISLRDHL